MPWSMRCGHSAYTIWTCRLPRPRCGAQFRLRSNREKEYRMYAFSYVKAKSLQEVSDFLRSNPDARPLAGGMTLIPTLKARLAQPSHLVDIGGLEELKGIEAKDGTLSIGAGTKHHEVMVSSRVRETIP